MNEWGSRTVTDVVGTAGSIVLSDESTAQRDLEDWPHDYYEGFDVDEMAWLVEAVTGSGITYEDNETLVGVRVEWSAERSAREIYEYLKARGEAVTMSRTAVSIGAMSLALGETGDEADMKDAAEYLRAVAHGN